jgi:caffeoyl-CoA O-methyltransferase
VSSIVTHPETYFRQLTPHRGELLRELESEAARETIPIVGPVVGELLYILARLSRARRILELGTATGYSAICLGEACRDSGGRLQSWESDPVMAERARRNIARAGLADCVEVRLGDALEFLAASRKRCDMVFMDIEKADYAHALPHVERLLTTGGLLLADNVAFKDAERFNRLIRESRAWRSISLFAFLPEHSPEHDGLCIALRV